MILPDHKLHELVRAGYLPPDVQIGPCSVDLRLGESFTRLNDTAIQYFDEQPDCDTVNGKRYLLRAGEFVLATTEETVRVPDHMAAHVHGRSSIGRLGLQIQNAGFIDAGFSGQITLELHNQSQNAIMLEAGWRVCQLSFVLLQEQCARPYSGKYHGQTGAAASKLWKDGRIDFSH